MATTTKLPKAFSPTQKTGTVNVPKSSQISKVSKQTVKLSNDLPPNVVNTNSLHPTPKKACRSVRASSFFRSTSTHSIHANLNLPRRFQNLPSGNFFRKSGRAYNHLHCIRHCSNAFLIKLLRIKLLFSAHIYGGWIIIICFSYKFCRISSSFLPVSPSTSLS